MPSDTELPCHSDTLVVLAHGLSGSPEKLASVVDAVHEALPGVETFVPKMPFGGIPCACCSPVKRRRRSSARS